MNERKREREREREKEKEKERKEVHTAPGCSVALNLCVYGYNSLKKNNRAESIGNTT